jgi:hypothetical protein
VSSWQKVGEIQNYYRKLENTTPNVFGFLFLTPGSFLLFFHGHKTKYYVESNFSSGLAWDWNSECLWASLERVCFGFWTFFQVLKKSSWKNVKKIAWTPLGLELKVGNSRCLCFNAISWIYRGFSHQIGPSPLPKFLRKTPAIVHLHRSHSNWPRYRKV